MATPAEKMQEAEYSRPEPLPLLGDAGTAAPYPVDALGHLVGSAAAAIASKVQVPPALAANSLLAACSLAVQPYVNVRLQHGQIRPVSLFLVTIAKSGDRKSATDEIATDPVDEFQKELQEDDVRREPENLARRLAWDTAKAEALTRSKKSGKSAIEEALLELGPRPQDPMKGMIKPRVGTTQGLLKYFEIARPSLGLMSDEGGSWLGGYGLSEDNRLFTVSTLSDLWDGKPIQRMTSGEGSSMLFGRRLTFHMMIQPTIAGRLLADQEFKGQGFLSRLLVAQPESLAGTRMIDLNKPVDPQIEGDIKAYQDRLSMIIRAQLPMDPDTRALKPKTLAMTKNAEVLYADFANEMERGILKGGPLEDVSGLACKMAEHAARMAAVLAVFEYGLKVEAIDDEMILRGINLARFYLMEAVRLFGVASPDPILADAQLVSDWLKNKWQENLISVGAIKQNCWVMSKRSSDHLRLVVAALVRHDHLSDRLPDGGMIKGKKVREVYRVQVRHA